MDADAPGLESYDGRRKNVDKYGERQVNRLGDVDYAVEGHLGSPFRKKPDSPRHDCHQVDDWIKFKEGTGHDAAKQGQEEGRRRTGVDCKHNDRSH